MRVHLDVLGWLHICCGAFAVLTGASLGVLASGTRAALSSLAGTHPTASPTVWLLLIAGGGFFVAGMTLMLVGRAIVRRAILGRRAALVLAIPGLLVIPFGTALAVYTVWALVNDEARREFLMDKNRVT